MIDNQILHDLVTNFQIKGFPNSMWLCRGVEFGDIVLLLTTYLPWVVDLVVVVCCSIST